MRSSCRKNSDEYQVSLLDNRFAKRAIRFFVPAFPVGASSSPMRRRCRRQGGMVTLCLNDKNVGEGRIDKAVPVVCFFADEAFDAGMDSGQPVSADYQ